MLVSSIVSEGERRGREKRRKRKKKQIAAMFCLAVVEDAVAASSAGARAVTKCNYTLRARSSLLVSSRSSRRSQPPMDSEAIECHTTWCRYGRAVSSTVKSSTPY